MLRIVDRIAMDGEERRLFRFTVKVQYLPGSCSQGPLSDDFDDHPIAQLALASGFSTRWYFQKSAITHLVIGEA